MNKENNWNSHGHSRVLMQPLHLTVCAPTGGQFQLSVSPNETVAGLKCALAKKLGLHAERMSLLYMDRLLLHGNLRDNLIINDSQLMLVPNMETGTTNLIAHSKVMQALENLTESQVNDFLTGKAPLLLAMKLGEHVMFMQLQLSASSCQARRRSAHGAPASNCCHSNLNAAQPEKPRCTCGVVPGSTSGAVIDSVNHMGQGVYSGTFSGTLDPSVQDPLGRPKRNVSTILQILNDLLVASPQFRQSSASVSTNDCQLRRSLASVRIGDCHTVSENRNVSGANVENKPTMDLTDSNYLRGKVQTLQKMMQERKLRRQERRGMRAPYQWPNRTSAVPCGKKLSSRVQFEPPLPVDLSSNTDTIEAHDATFLSATPLEQETVQV